MGISLGTAELLLLLWILSTLEEEYSGSLRRRLLLVLRDVSTKGKCSFRPFSLSFSTLPSNGLKMLGNVSFL